MKKMTNENRLIDDLVHAEDDLISRRALIAEYDRVHIGAPGGARKLMEDAPAVDAVEVVHAHWEDGCAIHNGKEVYKSIDCSHCNEIFKTEDREYWKKRFRVCPFCGAKMDGDKHE